MPRRSRPSMLIFLDTEFTNLTDRKLISIGMVSEDGQHAFYRELRDFDLDNCSSFVRANVLPLLGRFHDATVESARLPDDVRQWIDTLPRSLTIACDSDWDWEILSKSVGRPFPANISGRFDLRPLIDTTVFHKAVCRYHDSPDQPWHHALHDAHAHRFGWLAWNDARRQAKLSI
nr:MAG TPA: Oligoribonuclease [Inoviridae sp.]